MSQVQDSFNFKNPSTFKQFSLDPRFPCPWQEDWQAPLGHPEPDPQVCLPQSSTSKDKLLERVCVCACMSVSMPHLC